MNILRVILETGLIYGIMAIGVYISYSILDFPDLSVDGTFPLGTAVCMVMLQNSLNPWLALIAAFAAGSVAGILTGVLHVKLRIRDLLCGILTMTAMYSINYMIVGSANAYLPMDAPTIFTYGSKLFGSVYGKLAVIFIIAVIAKLALDWYLRTKSGFLLKSAGDNDKLVVTLAKNPGTIKIIGLSIANGLVALAGAVYCQYGRQFNVSGGTGMVVMGLAAVIIGTTVFKKIPFLKVTTGVFLGMIVYRACISLAMKAGLESQNNNLVVTILFIITLMFNEFVIKRKKAGVKKNA